MPTLASCNAPHSREKPRSSRFLPFNFRRHCVPASHHIHPTFLSNAEVTWDSVSGLRRFSVVDGNCSPASCDSLGGKSSRIRHHRIVPIPVCSSTDCVDFSTNRPFRIRRVPPVGKCRADVFTVRMDSKTALRGVRWQQFLVPNVARLLLVQASPLGRLL